MIHRPDLIPGPAKKIRTRSLGIPVMPPGAETGKTANIFAVMDPFLWPRAQYRIMILTIANPFPLPAIMPGTLPPAPDFRAGTGRNDIMYQAVKIIPQSMKQIYPCTIPEYLSETTSMEV